MPELQILVTGISFGESPRWHDGRLWFADWGTQELVAADLKGRSEVMARVPSFPFCLDWLPDGRLLVVSARDRLLLRREPDGSLVTHADLTGLSEHPWNDIVVDGRGNAYVGNIGFDFPGGKFAPGTLALVTPDGSPRQVADGLAFPNGVVVTPDNSTLVVAESYGSRLTAFDIGADGGLSNRRVWADLGDGVPDGICLDAEGAVWYADVPNSRCVRVREGGEVLQEIELDRGCFACMLGGSDGRTLFMVAREWRGMEGAADEERTGQILTAPAPAAGAGWPKEATNVVAAGIPYPGLQAGEQGAGWGHEQFQEKLGVPEVAMNQTRTDTLKVPGATLHYEVRGDGPVLLLIPGGPADAGTFAPIGGELSDRYTVVTYDPRGLSRSSFDGEPQDTTVGTFADDAHRLLAALGTEPAYVLASSGGALVGIELVSRHPEQVRAMVAHEPPLTRLLDAAEEHARFARGVHDTYLSEGVGPAMGKFLASAGLDQDPPQPPAGPTPEMAEAMARMQGNLDFFLGHMWLSLGDYAPDISRLRSAPIAVAVGEDSEGQLAYRAAVALAEHLGKEPVVFPGDHGGFNSHPEAFARRLDEVLGTC